MTKAQAINTFWNRFGIPAYDEQTVPPEAKMPYITYRVVTDSIGKVCNLTGSVWYRSTSWKEVSDKAAEIARYVAREGFTKLKLDNGYVWFTKGTPFAQRMADTDDMVRRIYLNIQAEFLTAY